MPMIHRAVAGPEGDGGADGLADERLGASDGRLATIPPGRERWRLRRRWCSRCRVCFDESMRGAENRCSSSPASSRSTASPAKCPPLTSTWRAPICCKRRAARSISASVRTGNPVNASASGRLGVSRKVVRQQFFFKCGDGICLQQGGATLGDHYRIDNSRQSVLFQAER